MWHLHDPQPLQPWAQLPTGDYLIQVDELPLCSCPVYDDQLCAGIVNAEGVAQGVYVDA